ncbi:rho GTPase-activating protein 21-like isoform X2 [Tubulanus polymorphus]|uniref:rho GTPase-activating protein 21-like isoform X2 n=1 Tax=Tubulanus polymorphus TaxID=672921 RepID=UPI003DA511FD
MDSTTAWASSSTTPQSQRSSNETIPVQHGGGSTSSDDSWHQVACDTSAAAGTDSDCWRGPRQVVVYRTQQGFGFTLRHFIVYPPDSTQESENTDESEPESLRCKRTKLSIQEPAAGIREEPLSIQEPMDTVFVKQIKPDGPASQAGLITGDRIVSINGESVSGKPYAQIIAMIQSSDSSLRLLVVPKGEDVLQMAYHSSAYHQGGASVSQRRGSNNVVYAYPAGTSTAPPSSHATAYPSRYKTEIRFASIDKDFDGGEDDDGGAAERQFYTTNDDSVLRVLDWEMPVVCTSKAQYSPVSTAQSPWDYTSSPTRSVGRQTDYTSRQTDYPSRQTDYASQQTDYDTQSELRTKMLIETTSPTSAANCVAAETTISSLQLQQQETENASHRRHQVVANHQRSYSEDERQNIADYKESLRKSQEDLFGACSKFARAAGTSGAAKSKTKTPTNENHHPGYHTAPPGGNRGINVVTASRTMTTTSYVTTTSSTGGSITVSTHSGVRFLPAYASPSSLNQEPDIVIRRRKSFDNILDDPSRGHHKRENIHAAYQQRFKLKIRDTPSSREQSPVRIGGATSGLSVTLTGGRKGIRSPEQIIIEKNTTNLVAKRTQQFEQQSSVDRDTSPSPPSSTTSQQPVRYRAEVRKISAPAMYGSTDTVTSGEQTTVAQRTAQFESSPNGGATVAQPQRKISTVHIHRNIDKMRQHFECGSSSSFDSASFNDSRESATPPPASPLYSSQSSFSEYPPVEYPLAEPAIKEYAPVESNMKEYTYGGSLDSYRTRDQFDAQSPPHRVKYLTSRERYDAAATPESSLSPERRRGSGGSDYYTTPATTSIVTTTASSSVSPMPCYDHSGSPVVLRPKVPDDDNGDVKLFRRTSYLMATQRDRTRLDLPINSTTEADGLAPPPPSPSPSQNSTLSLNSNNNEQTTPTKVVSMKKLKAFFGEKSNNNSSSASSMSSISSSTFYGSSIQQRSPRILEAATTLSLDKKQTDIGSPILEVTREGHLNVKIAVTDGRRASDRSWKQVWCVMMGHLMYFFKEKKEGPVNPNLCEEQPISLKASIVDIAYDYTKKKHVFRLNTYNGSQYLLQADDQDSMLSWIQDIQANNNPDSDDKNVNQSNLIFRKTAQYEHTMMKASPQLAPKMAKKIAALSLRARSPGHSPAPKQRKGGSEDSPKSKESKTWKGKVVKSIKRLGSSTETSSAPWGASFGVLLDNTPPAACNEMVPLVVELCTTIIEAKALEYVGLYRVPGNSTAVAMLQEEINKGIEHIDIDNERWMDVNVVSSLLKLFFRQLPDTLVPQDLYQAFINANRIEKPDRRMLTLKRLLHELPECHFDTFRYLAKHLKKVAVHGHINKMDAKNLAIVFGPTLLRNIADDKVSMVTDMSDQCRIVESIIQHSEWFFSSWAVDNEIPVDDPLNNIPPSAVTQTVVASTDEESDDSHPKELVLSIIQAANKKIQEQKLNRSLTTNCQQTEPPACNYRNIDEEIEKRKHLVKKQPDVPVTTKATTAATKTTNKIEVTTATTESKSESSRTEVKSTAESVSADDSSVTTSTNGIYAAKMIFLHGEKQQQQTGSRSQQMSPMSSQQQQQTRSQQEMSSRSLQQQTGSSSSNSLSLQDPQIDGLAATSSADSSTTSQFHSARFSSRFSSASFFPTTETDADSASLMPRRHSEEILTQQKGVIGSNGCERLNNTFGGSVSEQLAKERMKFFERELMDIRRKEEGQSVEQERRRADQKRIELEIQRTKREMEADDASLEEFIGTTKDIAMKIGDFTRKMSDGRQVAADTASTTSSDYSSSSAVTDGTKRRAASTSDYSSSASPPTARDEIATGSSGGARSGSDSSLTSSSRSRSNEMIVAGGGGKFFALKASPPRELLDNGSRRGSQQDAATVLTSINETHEGKISRQNSTRRSTRRGSLDSLRDFYDRNDRARHSYASSSSDDGCDLLSSLTTTFDQKLRVLLDPKYRFVGNNTATSSAATNRNTTKNFDDEVETGFERETSPNDVFLDATRRRSPVRGLFRDPSLHRLASPTGEVKVGIAARIERADLQQQQMAATGLTTSKSEPKLSSKTARVKTTEKPIKTSEKHSSNGGSATVRVTASSPTRRRRRIKHRRHTVTGSRSDIEQCLIALHRLSRRQTAAASPRKPSAWERLLPGDIQTWLQQQQQSSPRSRHTDSSSVTATTDVRALKCRSLDPSELHV